MTDGARRSITRLARAAESLVVSLQPTRPVSGGQLEKVEIGVPASQCSDSSLAISLRGLMGLSVR